MVDYSRFEDLAKQIDAEEEREKEQARTDARLRYEKEQKEKQRAWEQKQLDSGKTPEEVAKMKAELSSHSCVHSRPGHDHSHDHDHGHGHGHSHEHKDGEEAKPAPRPQPMPSTKSSCGFMPMEEIERLQKERASRPQISKAEKKKKKQAAVAAAREHGNILFKEGKFEQAFKVYERGVLIINGMVDLTDQEYEEMEKVEALVDLNMALCLIKQSKWTDAIDHCRMALNLDKTLAKAHFRWAQALQGMGEYEQALQQAHTALDLAHPQQKPQCDAQIAQLTALRDAQDAKAKQATKLYAKRLAAQMGKGKKKKKARKAAKSKPQPLAVATTSAPPRSGRGDLIQRPEDARDAPVVDLQALRNGKPQAAPAARPAAQEEAEEECLELD